MPERSLGGFTSAPPGPLEEGVDGEMGWGFVRLSAVGPDFGVLVPEGLAIFGEIAVPRPGCV